MPLPRQRSWCKSRRTSESSRGTAVAFTQIVPLHNSLVIFPRDAYHEITPVKCNTHDLLDGRFTVNGWLRSHEKDGAGG